MKRLLFFLCVAVAMTACSEKDENMLDASQVDFAYKRLKFQCAYEKDFLPPLVRDADILYKYSLYLESSTDDKRYNEVARYYRIAAAHDHYKAATNLQALLSSGKASSPDAKKETIDLVEYFIDKNIPGAYYDMGHYLEIGFGVKQDIAASRAYLRRAADLGSPDAQYYVGKLLSKLPDVADVMQALYKCSMEQGNRLAGRNYASYSKVSRLYEQSITGYQTAIRNGDANSASRLANAFEAPPPSEKLYYLELQKDVERVERYNKIGDFLRRHEHLGAKVPDLDDIVPLPPAPLPAWDGTFKWKRDRDAAAPLSPPPDELVQRMSAEKGLDPRTGLPLPKTK
jgi:hypothetical protein